MNINWFRGPERKEEQRVGIWTRFSRSLMGKCSTYWDLLEYFIPKKANRKSRSAGDHRKRDLKTENHVNVRRFEIFRLAGAPRGVKVFVLFGIYAGSEMGLKHFLNILVEGESLSELDLI